MRYETKIAPTRDSSTLPDPFGQSLVGAGVTPIAIRAARVAVFAETDDLFATNARSRRVIRRIHQLLKVVLVGAVPDVNLSREIGQAFRAALPGSGMALAVVVGAERVAPVVAVTTVPGIGEQHVLVLVVANPLATTSRADEFVTLAA